MLPQRIRILKSADIEHRVKTVNKNEKYKDIINLKRPKSNYKTMSLTDRAAQFSPFAALTGYDAAVKETARITTQKVLLDESEKEILNEKLNAVLESQRRFVIIKYFVKDTRKSGGDYITTEGEIKKLDDYNRELKMQDGLIIPIDDIMDIDSPIFNFM